MNSCLNEEQKIRFGSLLHEVLAEIRYLGWQGKSQQAGDLADVFESLPNELMGTWYFSWEKLKSLLEVYQQKYPTEQGMDFLDTVRRIESLSNQEHSETRFFSRL